MQKLSFKKAEPTIRPASPWSPKEDATALNAAMKGFGTDEEAIWSLLTARTNKQRQEIAAAYSVDYQTSLLSDLKSELSGDFRDLIVALMETPVTFACSELNRALSKWRKIDANTLTEIAVTRNNTELKELVQNYEILYKRPLIEHICDVTENGDYRKLVTLIFTGTRDPPGTVKSNKISEQVERLFEAGEGRLGTDEAEFINIFGHESFDQLALVFEKYKEYQGRTIEQALEAELSGELLQEITLGIVEVIKSQVSYFVKQLYKAMKGFGTDDRTLIRIIVSRSEIDLENIKREYEKLYNQTLESVVKSETSGDYQKGLISIIRGNVQPAQVPLSKK